MDPLTFYLFDVFAEERYGGYDVRRCKPRWYALQRKYAAHRQENQETPDNHVLQSSARAQLGKSSRP